MLCFSHEEEEHIYNSSHMMDTDQLNESSYLYNVTIYVVIASEGYKQQWTFAYSDTGKWCMYFKYFV